MPERLLIEAYIIRQDLSHPPGWETGRPSEPDYMELNLRSTRHWGDDDQPRVVVYQLDEGKPLNARGLLVAAGVSAQVFWAFYAVLVALWAAAVARVARSGDEGCD